VTTRRADDIVPLSTKGVKLSRQFVPHSSRPLQTREFA
jgi:hypothetical protein